MITIKDAKLVEMIEQKNALVLEGRKISYEMEKLEKEIEQCEEMEKKITGTVQPKELGEKAEKMKAEIDAMIKEFEKVANEITKTKLEGIPKDLADKHRTLMAKREVRERERNKIALKIQKIKDRMVPKISKVVKPQLKEYEDIETAEVKDGVVVVKTFSHLESWKEAFNKRK